MRTVIEFQDGMTLEKPNSYPSFIEADGARYVSLVDGEDTVITDDFDVKTVKSVTWEGEP